MATELKERTVGKRVLYAEAVYGEAEIEAVIDVLRNRRHALMSGPATKEFEVRVSALFGKAHGVMVNSGSSANLLAIASLDLPPGSEVITPALTFSTTVAPLVQRGLVPAFVDVEPDTYCVDADQVEAMVGPKTRALMIPNLIGNLPDWARLRDIADRHNLLIVEDSADTVGALFDGQPTGKLTDISTTSFYASHVMTAGGFGGMVCTSDPQLAQRARLLCGWGRSSTLVGESERIEDRFNAEVDGIEYDSKFIFSAMGFNFLPSEIGAAFGLAQYRSLQRYIQTRIDNFTRLGKFFADYSKWFVLPRQSARVRTGWLAFPLIVRPEAPFTRRELQVHFESNNIQTRTVFTGNILRQPGFKHIERREREGGYPNADTVMKGGVLLGCHQGLDAGDVDSICEVFAALARRY
jgi:dTDP-4-amino-4,6-dideoxygalactose transaminase